MPQGCNVSFRQLRTKWTALKAWLHLKAMSSFRKYRSKLGPAIAAPDDDHARVEADQRFQAALAQAIAAGGERVEAVRATVALERGTKPSRWRATRAQRDAR